MTKAKKPKVGTISAAVTALVESGKADAAIVAALRRKFTHLTAAQARAHVAGTRRVTGIKAPQVAAPRPPRNAVANARKAA